MNRKISVIGLGYVGLPVAAAFGKITQVIGFDINPRRIEELCKGQDWTGEIESTELNLSNPPNRIGSNRLNRISQIESNRK